MSLSRRKITWQVEVCQCGQNLCREGVCQCQVSPSAHWILLILLLEWRTLFSRITEHEVSGGALLATLPRLGRQWRGGLKKKITFSIIWRVLKSFPRNVSVSSLGESGLSPHCYWSKILLHRCKLWWERADVQFSVPDDNIIRRDPWGPWGPYCLHWDY